MPKEWTGILNMEYYTDLGYTFLFSGVLKWCISEVIWIMDSWQDTTVVVTKVWHVLLRLQVQQAFAEVLHGKQHIFTYTVHVKSITGVCVCVYVYVCVCVCVCVHAWRSKSKCMHGPLVYDYWEFTPLWFLTLVKVQKMKRNTIGKASSSKKD